MRARNTQQKMGTANISLSRTPSAQSITLRHHYDVQSAVHKSTVESVLHVNPFWMVQSNYHGGHCKSNECQVRGENYLASYCMSDKPWPSIRRETHRSQFGPTGDASKSGFLPWLYKRAPDLNAWLALCWSPRLRKSELTCRTTSKPATTAIGGAA